MKLIERITAPRSRYLLFAILVASMLLLLMPWTPWMPARGLDPSWVRTLDYAFESRFQFGPELLFTYGPLGFVQTNMYSPGSYPWVLAIRGVILFLLAVFYYKVLRPLPLVYSVTAALIIVSAQRFSREALYGSVPIVGVLVLTQDDVPGMDSVELALLGGAVSLMKFSFFTLTTLVFLIMAAYRFLRWREFPLAPILYAFAMIAWYLIAGQHLSSIWEYLRGSINVAAGYSEAMQLVGPPLEEIYFLLLAAALLLVVGLRKFRRRQFWALFPVVVLTAIVFVIFKEGFVRHDSGHVKVAFAWLVVTIALYTAEMSPRGLNPQGRSYSSLLPLCFL
jgi:hypothetical protein